MDPFKPKIEIPLTLYKPPVSQAGTVPSVNVRGACSNSVSSDEKRREGCILLDRALKRCSYFYFTNCARARNRLVSHEGKLSVQEPHLLKEA